MNQSSLPECLAIFGSVQRGDNDGISDRDILVASAHRELAFGRALSTAGYSPSIYSWPQLDALSREGSLFLQHLKQESSVLLDRKGRLGDLLHSFRPLSDYSHRIDQNLELLEMTNGTPDSPVLLGWAIDVLAVGFRNHAILRLANLGQYVFSYPALVDHFCKLYGLSFEDCSLLLELRRRKREYRTHGYVLDLPFCVFKRIQILIERVTGADCLSRSHSVDSFIARHVGRLRSASHWYYTLRRLEGIHRAMGFMPSPGLSPDFRKLELLFATPSPYGDSGSSPIEWAQRTVESLAVAWLKQRDRGIAA